MEQQHFPLSSPLSSAASVVGLDLLPSLAAVAPRALECFLRISIHRYLHLLSLTLCIRNRYTKLNINILQREIYYLPSLEIQYNQFADTLLTLTESVWMLRSEVF